VSATPNRKHEYHPVPASGPTAGRGRVASVDAEEQGGGSVRGGRSVGDGASLLSGKMSDLMGGTSTVAGGETPAIASISELLRAKANRSDGVIVARATRSFVTAAVVSVVVLAVCLVAVYVTGRAMLDASALSASFTAQAGDIRLASVRVAFETRALEMGAGNRSALLASLRGDVASFIAAVAQTTSQLSVLTRSADLAAGGEYDAALATMHAPLPTDMGDERTPRAPHPGTGVVTARTMTTWQLYTAYASAGSAVTAVAAAWNSTSGGALSGQDPAVQFVLHNGLRAVVTATWHLIGVLVSAAADANQQRRTALIALTVVVLVVPTALAALVFIPAVLRLRRHVAGAYQLFGQVPLPVAEQVAAAMDVAPSPAMQCADDGAPADEEPGSERSEPLAPRARSQAQAQARMDDPGAEGQGKEVRRIVAPFLLSIGCVLAILVASLAVLLAATDTFASE